MSTALDLNSLAREDRPFVNAPDGESYFFMMREDMGPMEISRMTQMEREFKLLSKRIQNDTQSKQLEKNARDLDDLYKRFVMLLLPEMPKEVIDELKTGMLVKIVQHWREHNSPNPTGGSQPES